MKCPTTLPFSSLRKNRKFEKRAEAAEQRGLDREMPGIQRAPLQIEALVAVQNEVARLGESVRPYFVVADMRAPEHEPGFHHRAEGFGSPYPQRKLKGARPAGNSREVAGSLELPLEFFLGDPKLSRDMRQHRLELRFCLDLNLYAPGAVRKMMNREWFARQLRRPVLGDVELLTSDRDLLKLRRRIAGAGTQLHQASKLYDLGCEGAVDRSAEPLVT